MIRLRFVPAYASAALLALAAAPAGAGALERIDATFLAEFSSPTYTIDQGEIVTFSNRDPFLAHGIASDDGSVAAPVIGRGQVRLLRSAPYLTAAGSPYLFHCPLHPGMTSELVVTASGSPLPADSTAPASSVAVKTGGVAALRKGRLRIALTPSEPVDAVITAKIGGVSAGRLERTYVAAGRRSVTMSISPRALKLARRAVKPLKVSAKVALSDAAGNPGGSRAARKLAPAR